MSSKRCSDYLRGNVKKEKKNLGLSNFVVHVRFSLEKLLCPPRQVHIIDFFGSYVVPPRVIVDALRMELYIPCIGNIGKASSYKCDFVLGRDLEVSNYEMNYSGVRLINLFHQNLYVVVFMEYPMLTRRSIYFRQAEQNK